MGRSSPASSCSSSCSSSRSGRPARARARASAAAWRSSGVRPPPASMTANLWGNAQLLQAGEQLAEGLEATARRNGDLLRFAEIAEHDVRGQLLAGLDPQLPQ